MERKQFIVHVLSPVLPFLVLFASAWGTPAPQGDGVAVFGVT
jgi:hypothetical protein